MRYMKEYRCGLVAIAAFILCVLISYLNGYTFGNWTDLTWIAALFIALAAGFCLRCRQKEDNTDKDRTTPVKNA